MFPRTNKIEMVIYIVKKKSKKLYSSSKIVSERWLTKERVIILWSLFRRSFFIKSWEM